MEVLSQQSGVDKAKNPGGIQANAYAQSTGSPSAQAPSTLLPLRYFAVGIAALLAGSAWLIFEPGLLATYHYNQHVIAATHLFVLGWICSIVMGAMYQLVPVALETKLHSERLAQWHFLLHSVGFLGMVAMFRLWNLRLAACFASVLALGVGFFVYNLERTLRRVPRWNVVAVGIAVSLCWLIFTILAGLLLAAAKIFSFSRFDPIAQMHAHAHLGVIGFFLMIMVAISFKLVPMFSISEVQSRWRAGLGLALLNAGLIGAFVAILISSRWKFFFALIVLGGFVCYGWELTAILRARKRRSLDWGLKYFLTAVALLLPLSMLTTQGCPMHESIAWGVKSALLSEEGIEEVDVKLVWEPAWTPARLSDHGRARLGIA